MPELISDTSPIQYLSQAGSLDLLPKLYGSVGIPQAVAHEIKVGRDSGVALPDLAELDWIHILRAPHLGVLPLAVDLGRGEREVLALGVERPRSLLLLDDRLGRHFARLLELRFTGTLGILLKAKEAGYLDRVQPKLDQLQRLGFWLDSATKAFVLEIAGER